MRNILGDVAAQLRGGIITVAEARGLAEIDARPHNQRKGSTRRRAGR